MGSDLEDQGAGAIPKEHKNPRSKFHDEISSLAKSQQYTRQRVTRLCNKIDAEFESFTQHDRDLHSEKLSELRKQLNRMHSKVISKMLEDDAKEHLIDEEVDIHEEQYDDRIAIHSKYPFIHLQSIQNNSEQSFVSGGTPLPGTPRTSSTPVSSSLPHSKLRLPEVPFPKFSNSAGDDFDKFIFSFESIIEKHNLPSYEKFIYLRNQLSKAPRVLIDSLDVDEQSYEVAKSLLIKAFSSDIVRKFSSIKKLSEIKMSVHGDPYDFIGEMRNIINLFRKLNIDIETVLTYFIWNGMTENFQNQLIQIVNSNKPSLDQIEENVFEAAKRFIRLNKKGSYVESRKANNSEATSMAINAEKKRYSKFCLLCKNDNREFESHFLSQCEVFDSVDKKINKLKELKGCTKCALLSHVTAKCHYKFNSQCRNCNGNHMSYLCQRNSKFSHANTTNNLNFTETLSVDSRDSILLPTMTVNIEKQLKVRALKDGGSQRNFISESVVKALKLPIVDRVNMNIHGFNSTNSLTTDIVEISFLYGECILSIFAVVVPNINISLNITGLDKLVNSIVNKGYKLADSLLENCTTGTIGDIDLIIGAESEHLFNLDYVKFGKSCYISSPIGIMLTGMIANLLDNIEFLPEAESFISNCSSSNFSFQSTNYDNPSPVPSITVLDNKGEIIPYNLARATEQVLNEQCNKVLDYDTSEKEETVDFDEKLVEYVLNSMSRDNTYW